MDKFTKITVGFVTQTFDKKHKGRFVCTHQEFIAGDECDYEDAQGNPVIVSGYPVITGHGQFESPADGMAVH